MALEQHYTTDHTVSRSFKTRNPSLALVLTGSRICKTADQPELGGTADSKKSVLSNLLDEESFTDIDWELRSDGLDKQRFKT